MNVCENVLHSLYYQLRYWDVYHVRSQMRSNLFSYSYSCSVVVTLSAADGVRGLLLQGRRKSSNLVVGQFLVDSTPATAAVSCDGPDDTLVAWYGTSSDAGFSSRSFTWLPPDDGSDGHLEFVYVTSVSPFAFRN